MKIFNNFFKPYTEFCLRTTFAENELKEVIENEFPAYDNITSIFKLIGCDETKVYFCKTKRPFELQPVMYCRNSMRGVISIQCEKTDTETLLHITIAPRDMSLFVWLILSSSILITICAVCAGVWLAIFALFMPVLLFIIISACRSVAENEIPNIKNAFENTLYELEGKYSVQPISIQKSNYSTRKRNFIWNILMLTVPVVFVLLIGIGFDAENLLSLRSFFKYIAWTVFFIDFPIGMCLLHYYFPQFFRHQKKGHYSIVPWGIFFLVCWGFVALMMFIETHFGEYPENGFAVGCAYWFGWAYIWVTMIPIGLIYLVSRGIQKLWQNRRKK